jgi:hypothetical protein
MSMHYGYIGLGNLGAACAGCLLKAGFGLTVYDLNPALAAPLVAAGATLASSAEEVASSVDHVITCLPSPRVSESVLRNILPHMKAGASWVEMSTLGREEVLAFAKIAADAGHEMMELPVTGPAFEAVDRLYPNLDKMRRRHEALRRVFGVMVEDVIAVAHNRLSAAGARSVEDIRGLGTTVIRFSKPLFQDLKSVRSFLFTRMYRAPSVMKERARVTEVVNGLFPLYLTRPELLPTEWQLDIAAAKDEVQLARVVADYVSGMTDRFALAEGGRLL